MRSRISVTGVEKGESGSMGSSIAPERSPRHLVLPERSHGQAKADLRIPEMSDKTLVGRAIQRAVSLAGLTNKEAAALIGVNDSQFGKWLSGNEPPQVHRVFGVETLRGPLVIALAEAMDDSGVIVTTHVSIKQRKVG